MQEFTSGPAWEILWMRAIKILNNDIEKHETNSTAEIPLSKFKLSKAIVYINKMVKGNEYRNYHSSVKSRNQVSNIFLRCK